MRTPARKSFLLAINGGSSSIRFALFERGRPLRRVLDGKLDRIGLRGSSLSFRDRSGRARNVPSVAAPDHRAAVGFLLEWLDGRGLMGSVAAVGHRVVHGMKRFEPQRVSRRLIQDLRRITPYDPEHLPSEIALIEMVRRRHPRLAQVVCFDTAFHRTMPRRARMLALPRRYMAKGLERYGFHGISYSFIMGELLRIRDPAARKGRLILAHLGNGASIAAVLDGRSIDTSMGFTPTAGLVMSTRSGDLDPGVVNFLARSERMSAARFQHMVNHESGLLGISGTSSDVRDLLAREAKDSRAGDALEIFCYQARKWIGSYAAALGGLDTLVFTGGIGENSPALRARICGCLGFLGISLHGRRNAAGAALISTDASPVRVRVIHTDEELMIARSAARILGLS